MIMIFPLIFPLNHFSIIGQILCYALQKVNEGLSDPQSICCLLNGVTFSIANHTQKYLISITFPLLVHS